jgi:hypothetical protein
MKRQLQQARQGWVFELGCGQAGLGLGLLMQLRLVWQQQQAQVRAWLAAASRASVVLAPAGLPRGWHLWVESCLGGVRHEVVGLSNLGPGHVTKHSER